MPTYTIQKAKHRAWPFRFGLYLTKKSISFRVTFDVSCKYDLGDEDQLDINKLFGVGYFPSHHKESARFGWRYNNDINKVEIFAYCYVNGWRVTEFITAVPLHKSCDFQLRIRNDSYYFKVIKDAFESSATVAHSNKRKIGYPLGVFFGGDQTAPHKIKIEMKKL